MDRRNFLKSVTGVATAVAAGTTTTQAATSGKTSDIAAPHIGSGPRTLRLALSAPDNGQGISDFCHQFAARVYAVTEGAIIIDVAHQKGAGLDAVSRGDADCYCATEHGLQRAVPELAFFAGLPGHMAMDAVMLHNWFSVGGGQDLWDRMSSDLGVKPLAIAHTGPTSGLWSVTPITYLSAISDQTIFAEGLAVDVVRGIGSEAFEGATEDVAQSISRGSLFAAEVGDIPTALGAGLVNVAKVVSLPGINRVGSVVAFGLRKTIWDHFTTGERALMESAAASTYYETLAVTQSQNQMMTAACSSQFGLRFEDLASEVVETVDRVSDIVIAHLAASSPRAERINASYMAFLKTRGLTS